MIFWSSGLMTAVDGRELMALFVPCCDLTSVPDLACLYRRWTFGRLFRAFSRLYYELPRVLEEGERQGCVLVLFFCQVWIQSSYSEKMNQPKAKQSFCPVPLNSSCKDEGYWLRNRHTTESMTEQFETGAKNDCTRGHQGHSQYCQGC